MNYQPVNEADLVQYVANMLAKLGWNIDSDVKTEVILDSGTHKMRADIVLYYQPHLPLAIIECKLNLQLAAAIKQAKKYTEILAVPYLFATDGNEVFFVKDINKSKIYNQFLLTEFPSKELLWHEYCAYHNYDDNQQRLVAQKHFNFKDHKFRHYQVTAVNKVIEAIAKQQKRILLAMAIGSGKSLVVLQVIWQLIQSGYAHRVLVLSDRKDLKLQTYSLYHSVFGRLVCSIDGKQVKNGYYVYIGQYQTLATELYSQRLFEQLPPDYFDVIVADECHNGIGKDSTWQQLLSYFNSAVQIGTTATPTMNAVDYFGGPVYLYDLQQSVNEGNVATARLLQFNNTMTLAEKDGVGTKNEDYFDYDLTSYFRIEYVAKAITAFLNSFDSMAKTIIFCSSRRHARYLRDSLARLNQLQMAKDSRYVVRFTADDDKNPSILSDFKNPDSPYPVIVTSVDKLISGVEIPSCKVIVIDREVKSLHVLMQMITRGSRFSKAHNKTEFTILDFSSSTKRYARELKKVVKETIQINELEQLSTFANPLKVDEEVPFNQVRVIVLGDERVGKSALIKSLTEKDIGSNVQSTEGKANSEATIAGVQLNISEFSKPGIIAFTHEIFFTPNSLYVYVLDANKKESGGGYNVWLRLIKAKTDGAPIIIVVNRANLNTIETNELERVKTELNIVDIVYITAHSDENLFKNAIAKNLKKLTNDTADLPQRWHLVKKALLTIDRSQISTINFKEMCEQHGIEDLSQMRYLLNSIKVTGDLFLHQHDYNFIEVKVVSYSLIEHWINILSKMSSTSIVGKYTRDEIFATLNTQQQHKLNDINWFIDFLIQYQQIFKFDDNTFLLPFKLYSFSPTFDVTPYQQGINYRFQYQSGFLVKIVYELAVALQKYIDFEKFNMFQQGVILSLNNAKAFVLVDEPNKTIDIAIDKESEDAKQLFTEIKHKIREINGPNMQVEEQMAVTEMVYEDEGLLANNDMFKSGDNEAQLPQTLLDDFKQWEYQLLVKIHQAMTLELNVEVQQRLPDLKRELTSVKMPIIRLLDGCKVLQGNDDVNNILPFANKVSNALNHLQGNNSIAYDLTRTYAAELMQWRQFNTQFNKIVEHYGLPETLMVSGGEL